MTRHWYYFGGDPSQGVSPSPSFYGLSCAQPIYMTPHLKGLLAEMAPEVRLPLEAQISACLARKEQAAAAAKAEKDAERARLQAEGGGTYLSFLIQEGAWPGLYSCPTPGSEELCYRGAADAIEEAAGYVPPPPPPAPLTPWERMAQIQADRERPKRVRNLVVIAAIAGFLLGRR